MAGSATATVPGRVPRWAAILAPLVFIGVLLGVFVALDPLGSFRTVPPVEAIAVERTVFTEDAVELLLRNDGPDPVRIAQVLVNDSYWQFTVGDKELDRLESTEMRIEYPWEDGLPLNIAFVTSTGLTIEHEIEAAALTPEFDASTLGIYALLGLYIGVIPVAIGLLWFSALRTASRKWIGFFLAFTVGLLAFLLLDTFVEGLELAGVTPSALDGVGLFAIGALGAIAALVGLQGWLTRRETGRRSGLVLAYLIAIGIGLHNLGEGLAVGAALAVGEVALGTFLVVGFALHNTTEGLAIVAPLGELERRPPVRDFLLLGLIAGAPTIAGAWLGGFAYSAAWSTFAFGIAAGAIAQVIWQITHSMTSRGKLSAGYNSLGFVVGLSFMYLTGLLTV
ncbi:MAG: ZIP family metal transporter [Actinomycetota bacterium]|nr:ZIP family metal transporter [Actinomycetota bacterium]